VVYKEVGMLPEINAEIEAIKRRIIDAGGHL